MKFGIGGRVPDTITYDKIFCQLVKGCRFYMGNAKIRPPVVQGVEFWHSPLPKAVAVNTVSAALPRACDSELAQFVS